MFDQLQLALVITKREVKDQFRDWRILFPILGLTVFFPFLMNFTAQQILNFVEEYGATIIADRLVPFLLMIVGFFPISVSLVIALESFVGEKERRSIEPLLNTPLENWQLYLGKLLAVVVPPLMASYLGMSVYLSGLLLKSIEIPPLPTLIQIFALTTVQAVMMVAAAVVISSQATSTRAANLLASFIIIPVALLIQGESIMMFWGTNDMLWWAVFGLFVLTILLVRVGLARFNREELLGRELDILNLRWIFRTFLDKFKGDAKNVKEWFLLEIPKSLSSIKTPVLISIFLAVAGFLIGTTQVNKFSVKLDSAGFEYLNEQLTQLMKLWPLFSIGPVLSIWWQNVRAMLIALVLGVFTLGVMGTIPLIFSVGVAGYLMGLLNLNGVPVTIYLLFILPHGLLEIPAVIIATASILKGGALIAKPDTEKAVGEILLGSLAEWIRIMLGVVIPLLLVAAAVEVWITPRFVLWLVK